MGNSVLRPFWRSADPAGRRQDTPTERPRPFPRLNDLGERGDVRGDVNDAERLCLGSALRAVVGGRAKDTQVASTSEMARFETATLGTKANLKHLMNLSGQWIDQARQHRTLTKLILDMDSLVSETYGHQEGDAYNGHFGCTGYHPSS